MLKFDILACFYMFERVIMSENFKIEQSEIKYKRTEIEIQQEQQTISTVPMNNIGQASNGTKTDKLDVLTDEQIKQEIDRILEQNDTTFEDFISLGLIENLEQLQPRQQLEAIKAHFNPSPQTSQIKEETPKPQKTKSKDIKFDEFNKKEYSTKELDQKIDQVKWELAKNIYINGSGALKGSNGKSVEGNGADAWNNLSDEQKAAVVKNITDYINEDSELKGIFDKADKAISSDDKNVKQFAEAQIDHLMNAIQSANINDENGNTKSVIEYLKKSDGERADEIYLYLKVQDQNSLTKNDKEYLERQEYIKNEVERIINEKNGTKISGIDIKEAYEYIQYYNLDVNEVLYNACKNLKDNEKPQNKWTDDFVEKNQKFMESKGGQNVLFREKIANYNKLLNEYEQLKNKSDRTDDENNHLMMLDKYLKSEEAQKIKEFKNDIPKPQGDFETAVFNDGQELSEKLSKSEFSGSKFDAAESIKFIESKLEGKTKEQRAEYIKTFIKLNPSSSSAAIFKHYMKEIPELLEGEGDLLNYASVHKAEMDIEQFETYNNNIQKQSKGNKLQRKESFEILKGDGKDLQTAEFESPKFDKHKQIYTNTTANYEYASKEDAIQGLNTGIDVTATITDAEMQYQAHKNITESDYMLDSTINDEVSVHTTDVGYKYHVDNQAKVVNEATQRSAKAAKHLATEKGLIAKYDKSAQTPIFKGTHDALKKHYTDDELVTYSKALADQIETCHKDNQLDMHREIMTSESSEVRTYAAGNIGNYDTSVQADATAATVATGDTDAIVAAYSSIKSPDVQNQTGFYNDMTAAVSTKESDLVQKIKSGMALTREEYESLTDAQKQEYRIAYFQSLSPAKQIQLITRISDVSTKKTIYKHIAQNNPSLLKNIIEHDASTAEFIYNMHVADNTVLSVAKNKGGNNVQFANLAKKIEKNNTKGVEKSDNQENKKQNKKVNKETAQSYMDSPFSALKDKKNPNIYIG